MCRLPPEGVPPACTWRVERGMGGGGLVVGAQDYAAARLCFSEGHRTLLPPSCNFLQKAGCNVDAPLGPEQDLKLLFLCNPKDPLRISVQITFDYVQFWQVWWAMGLPLHLAVAHNIPPLLFSNLLIYKTNTLPAPSLWASEASHSSLAGRQSVGFVDK